MNVPAAADVKPPKKRAARKRNGFCPVPDCQESGKSYFQLHGFTHHIPKVYDMRLPNNEEILSLRKQALDKLACWIFHDDEPVEWEKFLSLPTLCNIEQCHFPEKTLEGMRAMCLFLGLEEPASFQFHPINSVVVLLHWRCVFFLSALLTPDQREEWKRLFKLPPVSAVDCFFHLDRLRKAAELRTAPVADVLYAGSMATSPQVRLRASVNCYCNPDFYPKPRDLASLPQDMHISIGFHPKHATRSSYFRATALKNLERLLKDPRVVAIGEIGLDHSFSDTEWAQQNEMIRCICPLIQLRHVVLIHCRGISGDDGMEVHCLLQYLLKGLPSSQRIHLHSFCGGMEMVDTWLKAFPDTYFSFNRGINSFSPDQIQGMRYIEDSRLLLESDAPSFPQGEERFSSPGQLYDVAELVAEHRGSTPRDILELTANNALRLYQKGRGEGEPLSVH